MSSSALRWQAFQAILAAQLPAGAGVSHTRMTVRQRIRFSVRRDQRAPLGPALEQARAAAFPAGEYAGQESFMRASEISALARAARIGPGTRVLDLCCGTAGPGRLITAETGCDYLGVDQSAAALAVARARAAG